MIGHLLFGPFCPQVQFRIWVGPIGVFGFDGAHDMQLLCQACA